jgi:hypothetical protein
MSPEEVLAALASNPKLLIGVPESAHVDFKKEPYLLNTDKGKWELAKDVAGIANLGEGILVVGIRAEKTEGNFEEIAAELRPVPRGRLDKGQYHSIIRDMVRPAVNFDIKFFPDTTDSTKGYMSVRIQPLNEVDRWAIVRKMVNDNGQAINSPNESRPTASTVVDQWHRQGTPAPSIAPPIRI